jgi:hypothetical protein
LALKLVMSSFLRARKWNAVSVEELSALGVEYECECDALEVCRDDDTFLFVRYWEPDEMASNGSGADAWHVDAHWWDDAGAHQISLTAQKWTV